ncbi:translocation/assembly module TamB domain-containing protein [Aliiruegeria lutimaris]|uniref:Autotransporter translocation and assembly factor TamB n=1 Tax=Aliiruegeria lutimaris TaxID=571298 RepID=A0A1G9F8J9_9RHOB|nr:translocation/assembly module TamB domain-containing protein [Aliiruegeria lutimaris]SDK84712.1 Autotransporter translocation and assembly factor TamB [Aliiruegeria lutimaris]
MNSARPDHSTLHAGRAHNAEASVGLGTPLPQPAGRWASVGVRRNLMLLCMTLALIVCTLSGATAQSREDRGYVTRLLEDLLSIEGSEVLIEGMSGVTRGPVTVARVSASDHLGEWLVIRNLVIDWNRTGLISRNVIFRQVSAEHVTLRRWASAEDESLIPAEARGFSLPQLPVSFRIDELDMPSVTVSGPAFDVPALMEVGGSVNLTRNRGSAEIVATRVDGREDFLELQLNYDSSKDTIDFETRVRESPGGAASRLLKLPGYPSINLRITGDGSYDDFSAELELQTNSVERLEGSFTSRGDAAGNQSFSLGVGGDVRALFEPGVRGFFGPDGEITASAIRRADSSFELSEFRLSTAEMTISGSADVGADNIPNAFQLRGEIAGSDGNSVTLPFSGDPLSVRSAFITAGFDSDISERWSVKGSVNGFARVDTRLERVSIDGSGLISDNPGALSASFSGATVFSGLDVPDNPLSRLLGSDFRAEGSVQWEEGEPVLIEGLGLDAANARIEINGEVRAEDRSLKVSGKASGNIVDLSVMDWPDPFDVSGAAILSVSGDVDVIGGDFESDVAFEFSELRTGVESADRLLGSDVALSTALHRDVDGSEIHGAVLEAKALSVKADGRLGDARGRLALDATLDDLALLAPSFPGAVSLSARLKETAEDIWDTSLVMEGPGGLSAALKGALQEQASRLDVQGYFPGILSLPAPFNTGISVEGVAGQDSVGWEIDLESRGPGAIRAALDARLPASGHKPSFSLRGDMPLQMVNDVIVPNAIDGTARFSFQTSAPFSVEELSGDVTIEGASLSVVGITEGFKAIDFVARLNDGLIRIEGNAAGSSGGRVLWTGTTELKERFPTVLSGDLQSFRIEKPGIFSSQIDGSLVFSGDTQSGMRLGGGVTVGDTIVHLSSRLIPAAPPIPTIRHVNEPANVRLTRARAGVKSADQNTSDGPAIDLDVAVSVPGTVRVVGGSISAILGGEIVVQGDTTDIRPTGKIGLLDGKMSLLGRRLDLTSGNLWLQGGLSPWIELVARGERRDITLETILSGPVNGLNVNFIGWSQYPSETEPHRFNRYPPDEAVSRFFLGNPVNGVSALQAAQILFGATSAASGSLNDPFGLRLQGGAVSAEPEGSAPRKAPRPARRDVLLRVDSDSAGDSEVVIELELNNDLSIVGRSRSGGDSAFGFFFTRDY